MWVAILPTNGRSVYGRIWAEIFWFKNIMKHIVQLYNNGFIKHYKEIILNEKSIILQKIKTISYAQSTILMSENKFD